MSKKKKTLVDEALLDLENIQETLKNNTKEILRSTMKEEIEEIVAESMRLNEFDEEDVDDIDGVEDVEDVAGDLPVDDVPVDDVPAEEPIMDEPVMDEPEMGGDFDMVDMTNASDDDLISVFKKLSGEDEIEIVSDDEIKLNISEPGEYIIKTGSELPVDEPVMDAPVDDLAIDGPEMDAPVDDLAIDAPVDDLDVDDEITDIELDGEEDEFDEGVDESKIYEIAMNEDANPAAYDVGPDASLPTGDIEGQTASGEKEYADGDNLTGGFGEQEAKNGSGDAHAQHVMGANGKTDPADIGTVNKTNNPAEEEVNGSGYKADEVMKESKGSDEWLKKNPGKTMDDYKKTLKKAPKDMNKLEPEEKKTTIDDFDDKVGNKPKSDTDNADDEIEEGFGIGKGMSVGANRNESGPGSIGAPENPKAKNESVEKYNALLREAKKLKKENDNFKKVLGQFREKLTETVIYNQNLTHVTRLFTEHTTTKIEKENIIGRFDKEVSNVNESKKLFKSIKNELSTKKSITETVDKKLNSQTKMVDGSKMNESSIYADPSIEAIRNLMEQVEKR